MRRMVSLRPISAIPGLAIYRRRFDKMVSYDFLFQLGLVMTPGTGRPKTPPDGGSKLHGTHGFDCIKIQFR
jgi:hypothetical protein